ncbi:hypothetical protein RSOL_362430 [Rhizoctonia solani AG-3 Rhs1AP]|uniref:Fungal-type protein kinase domain-containing protein n=2 Tax=Rhizoctonia solani AG-3 TaxID=1086053 RepID=A0A074RQT1_9AGAM|nr:hypothetical protein RSOL_362430 [Rhizoctonia solani AG-3 Rhs1AP]KEP47058.1 hypothetical protein V565_169760 [Rhizoctonia solani 123E]
MIRSHISGLISSSISLPSQPFNEDSCYNQDNVALVILAALEKSETCDVDQLVAVFLDRCRATEFELLGNPSTRIPHSVEDSLNAPIAFTATSDPEFSTFDSESTADIPPVTQELLDSCLHKVIPICNTPEMRRLIQEYRQCPEEVTRYKPFVELANYALECVKSLELPGLREPSTSNILFHVNHKKGIKGIDNVHRFPDIILIPLASAQRVHNDPTGSWKECAENMGTRHGGFDWPDVLISGELKWHYPTLDLRQPETYDTSLKRTIPPIPTRVGAPNFTSIVFGTSASSNAAASGASILPSSTRSGSTQGSVSSIAKAQESPKYKTKEKMLEAVLQSGINAAEMLRCSLGRRHAFGMIIIDTIVWIWWFDRQGAIQSTGIDFNENLPRFLVFLIAIQRFDLADWGFDKELDPSISLHHTSSSQITPQPIEYEVNQKVGRLKVNFTPDIEKHLHEVFGIKGKSTNVFQVSAQGQPPLVAKLYWPNHNRPHEVKIIEHARMDGRLINHLPTVRGWRDIDPIGTRRIRDQLGISSDSPGHPKQLVIIIFEKLFPITMLEGNYLVCAWLQCVRAHYLLWEKGIRHLDLSLGNLMIRKAGSDEELKYYGVVNDWDLGDDEGNLVESRKDLTKTMLFTSLDLLEPRSPDAKVVQRYSHDLESFIWILIWVFFAVKGGEMKPDPQIEKWQTSDPWTNCVYRTYFLHRPYAHIPHEEWLSQWPMAKDVIRWLNARLLAKDKASIEGGLVDTSQFPSKNEVCNQKDSDLDETPEERKELLRSLLETIKKHCVEPTPPVLEIEDL